MRLHYPLLALSLLLAAIIAAPAASIVIKLFPIDHLTLKHLSDTVLLSYLSHSFILSINILVLTTLIAVSSAWLCSQCEFPGRSTLEWMLILPLSYPAYMMAYIYSGMLDYGGSLFAGLSLLGFTEPMPVRSLAGASILFSLVFYPYLYLMMRAAWLNHSAQLIDESRVLGATPWKNFLLVSLPLARPAMVVGVAIILMETLAEYGGVHYLGVPTLSVGIFRTWLGMDNLNGAVQLSAFLLLIVVFFFLAEKKARAKARYHETGGGKPHRPYRLQGPSILLAWLLCFTPPLLGFIVPSLQLLVWTASSGKEWSNYWSLISNSLPLAVIATLVISLLALLLAYSCRLHASRGWAQTLLHASAYGYAIPGTIVAVGTLSVSVVLDRQLSSLQQWGWWSTSLIASGSLTALILAYSVRFMTLGFKPVSAALEKIPPAMDQAARTLGAGAYQTLRLIHWPLIRSGVFSAALLIFVEVIRELPITMMLRPFNFNTLAVGAYEMAQDGRVGDAALPTLTVVIMGMLPLFILFKKTQTAA